MHWCFKFLWIVSIFGIIFFTFLAVSMVKQPEFLPFKPKNTDSSINACIIIDVIYIVVFLFTSFVWWRHLAVLRGRNYQVMIEEELRIIETHK